MIPDDSLWSRNTSVSQPDLVRGDTRESTTDVNALTEVYESLEDMVEFVVWALTPEAY